MNILPPNLQGVGRLDTGARQDLTTDRSMLNAAEEAFVRNTRDPIPAGPPMPPAPPSATFAPPQQAPQPTGFASNTPLAFRIPGSPGGVNKLGALVQSQTPELEEARRLQDLGQQQMMESQIAGLSEEAEFYRGTKERAERAEEDTRIAQMQRAQVQKELDAKRQQVADENAKDIVDPTRAWSSRSSLDKAVTTLGAGLFQFGQALRGGNGPNIVWQAVDRAMDNDIRVQEQQIGKRKTAREQPINALDAKLREFDDPAVARLAVKELQERGMQAERQAQITGTKGKMAKDALLTMQGQSQERMLGLRREQLALILQNTSRGSGGRVIVNPAALSEMAAAGADPKKVQDWAKVAKDSGVRGDDMAVALLTEFRANPAAFASGTEDSSQKAQQWASKQEETTQLNMLRDAQRALGRIEGAAEPSGRIPGLSGISRIPTAIAMNAGDGIVGKTARGLAEAATSEEATPVLHNMRMAFGSLNKFYTGAGMSNSEADRRIAEMFGTAPSADSVRRTSQRVNELVTDVETAIKAGLTKEQIKERFKDRFAPFVAPKEE